ncbi:hypothetical protein OHB26_38520 [Nocardia sp. NBC_01503]|uniref:hypothetical protein n=1 Tax=Nocardia sp. NBC_01503 TaxID=2975997 RepID=UPI002E7AF035|nr:hypothetical protein [Nocardia sp. NBC_01503]WTL32674.1 hypothetical protein OHB26_38520 [Nocardia sp. NBC_01503]
MMDKTTRRAGRRIGYFISIVINVVIAYLANAHPGWAAVPFLTEDTTRVLTLFNVSLAVSACANLVYIVHDGPRTKAFGDLVTLGIGLAVVIRLLQVFPFDADGWNTVIRIVLIVGICATAIGLVVALVTLVTGGRRRDS